MNERRFAGGGWLGGTAVAVVVALSSVLAWSTGVQTKDALHTHEAHAAAPGTPTATTTRHAKNANGLRLPRQYPAVVPALRRNHPSHLLRQQFLASTELRSYAIHAQRSASDGGGFYAIRAIAECRLRPSPPPDSKQGLPDTIDHRRAQFDAANAERWAMRCAAFLPEELSDEALRQIHTAGISQGDPLLVLMDEWIDALDSDDTLASQRVWRAVVAAGDASLLEWAVAAGAGLLEPNSRLHRDADTAAFVDYQIVWSAVTCELGAGCLAPRGPPDSICQYLARCARERWRSGVSTAGPSGTIERAVMEANDMAEQFRRRDAAGPFGQSDSVAPCVQSPCGWAPAEVVSAIPYR